MWAMALGLFGPGNYFVLGFVCELSARTITNGLLRIGMMTLFLSKGSGKRFYKYLHLLCLLPCCYNP